MEATAGAPDRKLVHLAPPSLFGPGQPPKFLLSAPHGDGAPRSAPRAVVAAAAAVLGQPRPLAEPGAAPLGQPVRREAPADARDAPWPPRAGGAGADLLRHSERPLAAARCPAAAAAAEGPGAELRFGDSVRLLFASAEGQEAALASAPPGASAQAEARLAEELSSSGRAAAGFAAATAVPLRGRPAGVLGVRFAWQVYRAEPLDGFPDDGVVRYGQLLRLGQRPSFDGGDELLLSCEPPGRGGGSGAAYLVLGRYASALHPDPREEQKAWNTSFRLLPHAPHEAPEELLGAPVDLRRHVVVSPASPPTLMHGLRALRPASSNTGGTVSLGAAGGGREWLLEGGGLDAPGVLVERLALDAAALEACDRHRECAHAGTPRALLGRALEAPLADAQRARSTPAALAGPDTRFARWERLRRTILSRVRARGPMALAVFRKAVGTNQPVAIEHAELGEVVDVPGADEAPKLDERARVPLEALLHSLSLDCGVRLQAEQADLIAETFAVQHGGHERPATADRLVDVDLFVDAVRGHPSPFRTRLLGRLYTQLQAEAGMAPGDSLMMHWVQERLRQRLPPEGRGQLPRAHTPEELLGALPLLRTHAGLRRAAFARWMADVTYHLPSHEAFVARVEELWGRCAALGGACAAGAWPPEGIRELMLREIAESVCFSPGPEPHRPRLRSEVRGSVSPTRCAVGDWHMITGLLRPGLSFLFGIVAHKVVGRLASHMRSMKLRMGTRAERRAALPEPVGSKRLWIAQRTHIKMADEWMDKRFNGWAAHHTDPFQLASDLQARDDLPAPTVGDALGVAGRIVASAWDLGLDMSSAHALIDGLGSVASLLVTPPLELQSTLLDNIGLSMGKVPLVGRSTPGTERPMLLVQSGSHEDMVQWGTAAVLAKKLEKERVTENEVQAKRQKREEAQKAAFPEVAQPVPQPLQAADPAPVEAAAAAEAADDGVPQPRDDEQDLQELLKGLGKAAAKLDQARALASAWAQHFGKQMTDASLTTEFLLRWAVPFDWSSVSAPSTYLIKSFLKRATDSSPGDGGAETLLQVTSHRSAGLPMPLTFTVSEPSVLPKGSQAGDAGEIIPKPEDARPLSLEKTDTEICCGTVSVLLRNVASKGVSSIQRGFVARLRLTQTIVGLDCAALGAPHGILDFLQGVYHLSMAFISGIFLYFFEGGSLQGCPVSSIVYAVSTHHFAERVRRTVDLKGLGTTSSCADDVGAATFELSTLREYANTFNYMQKCADPQLKPKKCQLVPLYATFVLQLIESVWDWLQAIVPE
ncbi:unnamed protein product [Prorocentrum cordatum]|uniref:Uncharacterized protein n=1 Tax=Prorocentrum cordatum TaxID=2364126 RepID=A0ABN9W551_9DINO|nr:unnamed protein product [Polarella glacialis]